MRTVQNHQTVGIFECLISLITIALFIAMFASAANAQEDTFSVQCEPTLDGYVATKPGIPRAIDLAHAAGSDGASDFVWTNARACSEHPPSHRRA